MRKPKKLHPLDLGEIMHIKALAAEERGGVLDVVIHAKNPSSDTIYEIDGDTYVLSCDAPRLWFPEPF